MAGKMMLGARKRLMMANKIAPGTKGLARRAANIAMRRTMRTPGGIALHRQMARRKAY